MERVKRVNDRIYSISIPKAYGYPITWSYLVRGDEKIALVEAASGASTPDLLKAIRETDVDAEIYIYYLPRLEVGYN